MTKRKKWILVGLLLAAIVATPFVVVRVVVHTLISRSKEHGITLTVESASPSFHGVALVGVRARIDDIPEASATLADIEVTLIGTRRAVAKGVRVEALGSAELLRARYAQWRSKSYGSSTPVLFDLEVSGIHATWTGALGPGSVIEAFDSKANVSKSGERVDISSLMQISFGSMSMKAFSIGYEEASRHAKLVVKPIAKEIAGSVLNAEIDQEQIVAASLVVARGPLSAWITDKRVLGHNPDLEVEGTVVLAPKARDGRAHVELKLFGAKFQSGSLPIDSTLVIEARRGADDTITLERGEAHFGPLRGDLKGGIGIGSHLWSKLTFSATPIPCSLFIKQRRSAKAGSVEEMAGNVTELLESAGIAHLEGTIGLEATLDLDLDRKERVRFDRTIVGGCSVSVF